MRKRRWGVIYIETTACDFGVHYGHNACVRYAYVVGHSVAFADNVIAITRAKKCLLMLLANKPHPNHILNAMLNGHMEQCIAMCF